jgi:glycosyltransferase involved in cell wall biosynthesis
MAAIGNADGADILNIKFPCPPELLQVLYHASDAVLANSGHEPFGLVGLETMAAGGIAFTGGTGEDYAVHLHNSVILETADPREIETYLMHIHDRREVKARIRGAATRTARRFTWEEAISILIEKASLQGAMRGVVAQPRAIDAIFAEFGETDETSASTGIAAR